MADLSCYNCAEPVKAADAYYETFCGTIICEGCTPQEPRCRCKVEKIEKLINYCEKFTPKTFYEYKCHICDNIISSEVFIESACKYLICSNRKCLSLVLRYEGINDSIHSIMRKNQRIIDHMQIDLFEKYVPLLRQICNSGILKAQFDIFSKQVTMAKALIAFGSFTNFELVRKPYTMPQKEYINYLNFINSGMNEQTKYSMKKFNYLDLVIHYLSNNRFNNNWWYHQTDNEFLFDIWTRVDRICEAFSRTLSNDFICSLIIYYHKLNKYDKIQKALTEDNRSYDSETVNNIVNTAIYLQDMRIIKYSDYVYRTWRDKEKIEQKYDIDKFSPEFAAEWTECLNSD